MITNWNRERGDQLSGSGSHWLHSKERERGGNARGRSASRFENPRNHFERDEKLKAPPWPISRPKTQVVVDKTESLDVVILNE